jgi:hypothetical protein
VSVWFSPNHAPRQSPSQLLSTDPVVPLSLPTTMAPPSRDLILPLLLLLLVSSSGAEPYPLVLVPRRCSPSSSAAYRLGPAVESHDPGARPLPYGVAWWVNRQSSWLPHELFRSDDIPEPEWPTSLEGSVDGGPGAARLAAWWRSLVPAVLEVGPMDRWRCASFIGDYRDLAFIVFFFSSLLIPLTAR